MRYHTELQVNLGVLRDNFSELSKIAPHNKVIFMIKADAYGHGLVKIAQYAWDELGVESFGVASLGEAVALRKCLPSMRSRIFVFSDTNFAWKESREHYLDYNVVPVIASLDDLRFFLDDRQFANAPLVVKLDTGMNRLGIDVGDCDKVISLLKARGRKRINHLMTHFASSFIPLKDGDRTNRQIQSFAQAKKTFGEAGIAIDETSCANSGAIEQGFALGESHIRPGLMLYGPASLMGGDQNWRGRNISSLVTHVLKAFPVKKGTPVGYGAHVCHKDGLLVYLPIGYGDGILTSYAKSEIIVEGRSAKILGRVNMDLTALLFEKDALGSFKVGQAVRLWENDSNSVSRLAENAGVIPYQVLTAISSRIPRSYRL